MRIAFDAKRIYQNTTGLGNYSRTLVSSLAFSFPEHQYHLYAPRLTSLFDASEMENLHVHQPNDFISKRFKSLWRSSRVKKNLLRDHIDIYHGLSHEIPVDIQKTGIKTVVTIHDLIMEKYPSQFKFIDRTIYHQKFLNACKHADKIISVSEQTKKDIIDIYGIDANKITTTYQSCNKTFYQHVSTEQKNELRKAYQLPETFFLYVGSIIERKNLLGICKAYALNKRKDLPPLVVVGKGDDYMKKVKQFIQSEKLESDIIFLSELSPNSAGKFNLAALYQMSAGLIYPSIYEGFGIPLLEAMACGTMVITSQLSCLPEVGGDAALYVDPFAPDSILDAMMKVTSDHQYVTDQIAKGRKQAELFKEDICAQKVMNVYQSLMHG